MKNILLIIILFTICFNTYSQTNNSQLKFTFGLYEDLNKDPYILTNSEIEVYEGGTSLGTVYFKGVSKIAYLNLDKSKLDYSNKFENIYFETYIYYLEIVEYFMGSIPSNPDPDLYLYLEGVPYHNSNIPSKIYEQLEYQGYLKRENALYEAEHSLNNHFGEIKFRFTQKENEEQFRVMFFTQYHDLHNMYWNQYMFIKSRDHKIKLKVEIISDDFNGETFEIIDENNNSITNRLKLCNNIKYFIKAKKVSDVSVLKLKQGAIEKTILDYSNDYDHPNKKYKLCLNDLAKTHAIDMNKKFKLISINRYGNRYEYECKFIEPLKIDNIYFSNCSNKSRIYIKGENRGTSATISYNDDDDNEIVITSKNYNEESAYHFYEFNKNDFNFEKEKAIKVFIEEENTCAYRKEIKATQNYSIEPNYKIQNTCTEKTNGKIIINTNSDQYLIKSNWETVKEIDNLPNGEHSFYIKDKNDCIVNFKASIGIVPIMSITSDIEHVKCFNQENGKINFNFISDNKPESIFYDNKSLKINKNNFQITSLSKGEHNYTFTDSNGCTQTKNITINEPESAITISGAAPNNVQNKGENEGFIIIYATGGNSGTYSCVLHNTTLNSIYNFEDINDAINLPAGDYTLTVKDSKQCEAVYKNSIKIEEPEFKLSADFEITPPRCFGEKAHVKIIAKNGWGKKYAFYIDNEYKQSSDSVYEFDTDKSQIKVRINDKYGGLLEKTIPIPKTKKLILNQINTEQSNCLLKESNSGKIELNIKGGNTGNSKLYLYSLSNLENPIASKTDFPITHDNIDYKHTFSNLYAGKYKIVLKDSKECTQTIENITIEEPEKPISVMCTLNAPSCNANTEEGESTNGAINLQIKGGWGAPYTAKVSAHKGEFNINKSQTSQTGTIKIDQLLGGTHYAVSILDKKGAEITRSIFLHEPPKLELTNLSSTHTTCEKDNGTLSCEAIGGTGTFTYQWKKFNSENSKFENTGNNTQSLQNKEPGIYSVSIMDEKGCKANSKSQQDTVIYAYSNPIIKIENSKNVACFGQENGEVKIIDHSKAPNNKRVQKRISPIQSLFLEDMDNNLIEKKDANSHVFEKLKAGKYKVYAKDQNECVSNDTLKFTIEQPKQLKLTDSKIYNCIKKGGNKGRIEFYFNGGNLGHKTCVLLKNEMPIQTKTSTKYQEFDNLTAGKYTIQITDPLGCQTNSEEIIIQEPAEPLTLDVATKTNAKCKAATGSVSLNASGGWGNYQYKHASSPFQDSPNFKNLYAGTYIFTVKDKANNTQNHTVIVEEPIQKLAAKIEQIIQPKCPHNEGTIQLAISGGTPQYLVSTDTKNWQSTTKLKATSKAYTIYVKDAHNCKYNLEYKGESTQIKPLKIENKLIQNANCNQPNGSISLEITGGTPPYSYKWFNQDDVNLNVDNKKISSIGVGNYQVEITDKNNCNALFSNLFVNSTYHLIFNLISKNNCTHYTKKDGNITLNLEGNTQPIQFQIKKDNQILYNFDSAYNSDYSYSNSTQNLSLSNLNSGMYQITAKESDDAFIAYHFEISKPKKYELTKTIKHVYFPEDNSGLARIDITGGVPPYTYKWEKIIQVNNNKTITSTNNTSYSFIQNVSACKYRVIITDLYNYEIIDTLEVLEPKQSLNLEVELAKSATCYQYANGFIKLKATGGWGDYEYKLNKQSYNYINEFSNLKAQKYTLGVIDAMGVEKEIEYTLTQPNKLEAKIKTITQPLCFNNHNAKIELDIKGGSQPYKYSLDNINWTEGTLINNLRSQNYSIYISDAHNCEIETQKLNQFVDQPQKLEFENIEITHTTCALNNASLHIKPQGGIPNYQYKLTDFNSLIISEKQQTQNLKPGEYFVELTDKNKCQVQKKVRINNSKNPQIQTIETHNVLCKGENTGTAIATIQKGIPEVNYKIEWSNGDTQIKSSNFAKGSHNLKITDDNGCTDSKKFVINEPEELKISHYTIKNSHCFGYNNGEINVESTGGVGTHKYLWNHNKTEKQITQLAPKNYTLMITDENDCIISKEFTITEPDKVKVDLGKEETICSGSSLSLDPGAFSNYLWTSEKGYSYNQRYAKLTKEDKYFLKVVNEQGCIGRDTFKLKLSDQLLKADFILSSNAQQGDTIKLIEVSNIVPDLLKWSYPKENFKLIDSTTYQISLLAQKLGIYNIELKAFKSGCVSNISKQVLIEEQKEDYEEKVFGVKDKLIKSFKLYPVPNNGKFKIDIELKENKEILLRIYNINKTLQTSTIKRKDSSNFSIDVDVSNYGPGIYLILLEAGEERKRIKVIVY